jgi:mRNA interferase MazF
MIINQGDLILLSYPFSNLEEKKLRPALIISNNLFNKTSSDCIMVPLTSVIKNESHSIIINSRDLEEGKLLKISRIKADKIFSIEKSLIKMKIGKVNKNTFEKVKKVVYSLVD